MEQTTDQKIKELRGSIDSLAFGLQSFFHLTVGWGPLGDLLTFLIDEYEKHLKVQDDDPNRQKAIEAMKRMEEDDKPLSPGLPRAWRRPGRYRGNLREAIQGGQDGMEKT